MTIQPFRDDAKKKRTSNMTTRDMVAAYSGRTDTLVFQSSA